MLKHDSMTAYISDRASALAPLPPFDFFRSPHTLAA